MALSTITSAYFKPALARESGIEAMRIVSMFLIVTFHFAKNWLEDYVGGYAFVDLLLPLGHVAVDAFFMISGWHLVKSSFRSVANLVFKCLVFNVILLMFCAAVDLNIHTDGMWKYILFPVTWPTYWFLAVYLVVMVLSPILNAAARSLDFRTYTAIIIGLFLFCGISPLVDINFVTNPQGMSVIQGVWMYLAGHWLRRFSFMWNRIPQSPMVCGFIGFSLLAGILTIVTKVRWDINSSPVVFLATICFFLFFVRLNFRSRCVNYLGGLMLGIYVIHTSDILFYNIKDIISAHYFENMVNSDIVDKIIYCLCGSVVSFIVFLSASALLTPVVNRLAGRMSIWAESRWFRVGSFLDRCGRM